MVKRINNIITAYFFFNRRAEKARRPKEAPLLLVSSCLGIKLLLRDKLFFIAIFKFIFGREIVFEYTFFFRYRFNFYLFV